MRSLTARWMSAVGAVVILSCTGATGPAGPQGPSGERGATGSSGGEGPQGVQGEPGQNGQNGTNGTNGTNGPNGVQGPPGDAGPPGRDLRFSDPGLVVTILDAGIADGGATIDLRLTDDAGRGLDRTGTLTAGAISVSFVLGYLEERATDGFSLQYVTHTRRIVTYDGGSFPQNAAESNGTWLELDGYTGTYRYQFATPIPVAGNAAKTHTIGLYATRTVQGVRAVANALTHFRPDGQPVTRRRELISNQGCNTCHTRLEAHGGARRDVGLCIMCHTNSADIDPDTGNSFDFKTMVHAIHRGRGLPSVDAGVPYRFVGFNGAVSDYSSVAYPGSINDCEACHTGGDRWKTNPTQDGCRGCHDRTWFGAFAPPPTYVNHFAGPRQDTQCIICHAEGSVSAIPTKHPLASRDPQRLAVVAGIVAAPATPPGARPQITFSSTVNGQPRDVLTQRLSRLRFVFAGPNTDVARFVSETAENAPDCAAVLDGGACLERLDAGVFRYRALNAMAPTDVGSFTVGIEMCATSDAGVRWCALDPVAPFAVTDPVAVARRKDVTLGQCNACHQNLSAHGGPRNNTEHCVSCHNGNLVENVATPIDGGTVVAPAANFKDLVHRIHSQARYPSPLNHCQKCHTATAYALPLPAAIRPSRSELRSCVLALPDGGPSVPADGGLACLPGAVASSSIFEPPTSAACTGCHSSVAAQAHAMLNTTSTGLEACAVCHASRRSSAVDTVHALTP